MTSAKYLSDLWVTANDIQRYTAGCSFEDYLSDDMRRRAVERLFEILGEACAQLRRADSDLAGKIPDLSDIVAFRNILIHNYGAVDDGVVWDAAVTDVPQLIEVLKQLLQPDPTPSVP